MRPGSAVAHDGMTQLGELSPDLAAAARLERELEHGRLRAPLQHAIARHRFAAATTARRVHAKAARVLGHAITQRPRRRGDAPLDDRNVHALRGPHLDCAWSARFAANDLAKTRAGRLPRSSDAR